MGRCRRIIEWVKDNLIVVPFIIITGICILLDIALLCGWKPKFSPLQYRNWEVGDCFIYREHEEWEEPSVVSKIVKEGKENWGIVLYLRHRKEWDDKIFGKDKGVMKGWFAPLKVDCPKDS